MKDIIKEDKIQTVNDVQLKDLYDAACKTEQQIINLSIASMSFSNPEIKKCVVALKSQASNLTQLIGGAMQIDDNINIGGTEEKTALDAAPEGEIIESVKKIMEALDISEDKAKKLVEAFDFKKDVLGKESKEENEDDTNTEDKEVDMCETFDYMKEGNLPTEMLEAFKKAAVKNLQEAKIDKTDEYIGILGSIGATKNIKEINEAFNALYDYADSNNIKIITKK